MSAPTFDRRQLGALRELATRFTSPEAPRLEGLILVMPEPSSIRRLLDHLDQG